MNSESTHALISIMHTGTHIHLPPTHMSTHTLVQLLTHISQLVVAVINKTGHDAPDSVLSGPQVRPHRVTHLLQHHTTGLQDTETLNEQEDQSVKCIPIAKFIQTCTRYTRLLSQQEILIMNEERCLLQRCTE